MKDWDQKLWNLGTSPLVIGFAALLQMKSIAESLRAGAPVEQAILLQWFLPLGVTLSIAAVVAYWGWRNFWSLTRTVLVGLAFTLTADPIVKAYVALLAQG